ncbi:MAG: hypothetical protein KKC03_13545 [Bacteroidetes bacterium]|nr:hypothetical protein [Bacteroidota bacterium]
MIKPAFFLWVLVPPIVFMAYLAVGLPHLRWSYTILDNGDPYNPYVERYYLKCTYIAPWGHFVFEPSDGDCPLIKFHPIASRGKS